MVNAKKKNKTQIVEGICRRTGLSKSSVEKVIDELLDETVRVLRKGESINFIGYFSIFSREQSAKVMTMRFGKDKGKKKKIPAKKVPAIKFSPAFKERITG